jgi:hypothetical protein
MLQVSTVVRWRQHSGAVRQHSSDMAYELRQDRAVHTAERTIHDFAAVWSAATSCTMQGVAV